MLAHNLRAALLVSLSQDSEEEEPEDESVDELVDEHTAEINKLRGVNFG